jgi:cyclopropane fatty-acyl-phospholipid synthase-like methyltransferase
VTRHLKNQPDLHLTACDIHAAAISFLKREIGVESVQSVSIPEALHLPRDYDAVFALSFFSHMPMTTWERWLRRLIGATRPGGVVIFTTQGIASSQHFGWPEIPSSGFWFEASSEQKDLSTDEYGQTIVTPQFARGIIAGINEVELIALSEGYWWGHQDLYVLRRH